MRGGKGNGQRRPAFSGSLSKNTAKSSNGDSPAANSSSATAQPKLSAQAQEFVPGQPSESSQKPTKPSKQAKSVPVRPKRQQRPKVIKPPKYGGTERGTTIQEDIVAGRLSCSICTENVTRRNPVFSCPKCYNVLHWKCVKEWVQYQDDAEKKFQKGIEPWRGPCCNSEILGFPKGPTCWCAKEPFKGPSPATLPPHSCGEMCQKELPNCDHRCIEQCHAGVCPPCPIVNEISLCHCGAHEERKSCRQTDRNGKWSCGEPCRTLLQCGTHSCEKPCHPGPCEPCHLEFDSICFCGEFNRRLRCGAAADVSLKKPPAAVAISGNPCASACAATSSTADGISAGSTAAPSRRAALAGNSARNPSSISALVCVTDRSSAADTPVPSFAIADLALPAAMASLKISPAIAAAPFFARHCAAARSLRSARSPVSESRHAVILLCHILATATTQTVQSVLHRSRSDAHVEGRPVATFRATSKKSTAAHHVAKSFLSLCHGKTPCSESLPCPAKVTITCECGHRKSEVKCLACDSNLDPAHKTIQCDDECARLARNARLADALKINPETELTDHVPYSDDTITAFQELKNWAEKMEREIRVFAATPGEHRIALDPMDNRKRQFIHLLCKDHRLTTFSQDAGVHRHVTVEKPLNYPGGLQKTLGQCVKIRAKQAAEKKAEEAAAQALAQAPFNALLLTSVGFGLTVEDIKEGIEFLIVAQGFVLQSVKFLHTEEVLLRITASYSASLGPNGLESGLLSLRDAIVPTVKDRDLAGNVVLVAADWSDHLTRRERVKMDPEGWNAIARKVKEPQMPEEPAAAKGKKVLMAKKKQPEAKGASAWGVLQPDAEA
ncbi:transcriptional repressor NF-X1 [Emericellopsis cladophorae]|uniref:Transcriptional repressor NF-X1 n=1 Tax=Emericellopsis cladophorae TaxID=2686198 RepID=A0A9Q0BGW3_9HYPO|nr:transcriptional repressor NF-X1 [Emericellopsis cladophorae]KAI6783784.1 transcriptional repressor NF-X1 [Emericellopsis cladophorae]